MRPNERVAIIIGINDEEHWHHKWLRGGDVSKLPEEART